MDNFKININPPEISDEQALKHKDFSKVMASYQAMKLPFYKTLRFWLWTAGSFTILVLALLFIFGVMDSNESYIKEEVIMTTKNHSEPSFDNNQPAEKTEPSVIITTDNEETVLEEKKEQAIVREPVKEKVVKQEIVPDEKVEKVIEMTPTILVCGKQSGEKVHKMQLGTVGKLTGFVPETNEKLTVLSFDMEYKVRGKVKTLHSDTYKLSKAMLYATDDMKDGDIVRFTNVRCQTKDGMTFTIDAMSILIDDGMVQW